MINRTLSVTEVNHFIKTLLDSNAILNHLIVEGEISNFTGQSSGHLYFSLKDATSRIACVMFKSSAAGLKFLPENGMKVHVKGNVSLFERNGQYQIYVKSIDPVGVGGLHAAYEQLKTKYEALGWFAEEMKKPLPESISVVGIVTSPTGAAVHDMISIISRRNPGVKIVLVPSLVQGDEAPDDIATGIAKLDEEHDVDIIVVGRGGGSIEDLWAFNDETVVNAIHRSQTPVVSAVGHETDFTLADFVADLRAPTPSAAGEMVAEDISVYREALDRLQNELEYRIYRKIDVDRAAVENYSDVLKRSNPLSVINHQRMLFDMLKQEMTKAQKFRLKDLREKVVSLENRLKALNPEAILRRGYTMILDDKGHSVTKRTDAQAKQRLSIRFADGELPVEVVKE